MLNEDRCYDYNELNDDLLKQFSEGSIALEDLLKFCYQKQIVTRACCIGHDEDNSLPYVAFLINEEQYKLMEHVFNQMFNGSDFSNNIFSDFLKENDNILLSIHFNYRKEELRDEFFNILNQTLKNYVVENKIAQGKYDNLLSVYDIIHEEDEIVGMTINSEEINASKEELGYFKYVNGIPVETTKEEADFSAPISEVAFKVKTDDIESYINEVLSNNKKLN